jgi:hypothetical protein
MRGLTACLWIASKPRASGANRVADLFDSLISDEVDLARQSDTDLLDSQSIADSIQEEGCADDR